MKSLEAENGVIGSLILDESCLPEISALLTPDDFQLEPNRKIYEAALALARDGKPTDAITIAGVVGESYAKYMVELMEITPTSANAGLYAKETRRASMWRSLKSLGEELARADTVDTDPRQAIGEAVKKLERIEAQDTAQELVSPSDALNAFYAHRALVDCGSGGCVRTGFRQIDAMLGGGFLNSGLYVLAARPGIGKTTLALAIADKVAETGGGVLFESLEMDTEQLMAKRIARITGISEGELMMDKLGEEQYKKVNDAAVSLSKMPLYMNKKPWATVDDIRNQTRKVKNLRLVVIDYFGLIRTPGKASSRYEAMTDVSGQLKALARSLGVPVLCLAQLNRENTKRKGMRPMLSDLRDTGALEQDADGVIFLHRPDYYEAEGAPAPADPYSPVTLDVILAKNRHGATGSVEMAFYLRTGKIVPYSCK